MNADLNAQKAVLRERARAARQKISPAARDAASAQLCARLKEQSFWKSAASILFFAPLPGEIDIWPLLAESLAAGKVAALPRFDATSQSYIACQVRNPESEIVTGQFGIREPVPACVEIPLNKLHLILVPGIGFDLKGHRLGRGRGFYDRLLAKAGGVKCGIAFDEQIVEAIPAEAHDVRMSFILTPARCVKCDK